MYLEDRRKRSTVAPEVDSSATFTDAIKPSHPLDSHQHVRASATSSINPEDQQTRRISLEKPRSRSVLSFLAENAIQASTMGILGQGHEPLSTAVGVVDPPTSGSPRHLPSRLMPVDSQSTP